MATQSKSITYLALINKLVGARIHFDNGVKIVKEILDYDPMTHMYKLEFENGDVQGLPDKMKYEVEYDNMRDKDKRSNNKIVARARRRKKNNR